MPSIKDIGELIKSLELKHKVGLAGSFARGTAKKSSDIDIVVDTDYLDIADMELIKEVIKSKFNRNSDVICLGLLYEEDCKLDELAISVGLDANEDSAYKSILREVIWFE